MEVDEDEAVVRVQGTQRYTVTFLLEDGKLVVFCSCPYAEYEPNVKLSGGASSARRLTASSAAPRPGPFCSEATRTRSIFCCVMCRSWPQVVTKFTARKS